MKLQLVFTLLFFQTILLNAQQTVNDPNYGFQFSVPDGWDVVNNQDAYLFTSNNYPGLIVVGKEPLSDLATMKQNLLTPYSDGETQMASSGNVEALWPNALGTDISGTMFGTQCKAYMVDVLVPGTAVGSVLVAVESGQYNDAYKQMCIQIAQSINNGVAASNQTQNQGYTNQSQTQNQQYNNQTTTSNVGNLGGIGNAASEFAGYRLVWIQTGEYDRSKVVFDFCNNGTFKAYEFSGYAVSNLNGSGASDMGEANMYGKWRLDRQGENYKLTTIDQNGNKGESIVQPYVDEYGDQRFNIGGKGFGYYGSAENCY